TSMLLRRAFSIYRVAERGVYGGTVEIVFSVEGKGTHWLAGLRAHDPVDIVGPLGRPFALPREAVNTTLVGGGYGAAPLFAVEESMACGIGVCMTCVLPVVGEDGQTRMVRSCVEGPVFNGDHVRWDDIGTVPADALGAPGAGERPHRPVVPVGGTAP